MQFQSFFIVFLFFFNFLTASDSVPVYGSVYGATSLVVEPMFSDQDVFNLSDDDFFLRVVRIVVSSKSPYGFIIKIQSDNNSKLLRHVWHGGNWDQVAYNQLGYESGNTIQYNIALELGNGVLGFQDSSFQSGFPVNISSDYQYQSGNYPFNGLNSPLFLLFTDDDFSHSIKESTVQKEIYIWCYIPSVDDYKLRGVYKDNLTISLIE
eukprot:COSAG01_NODE_3_length_63519_cov_1591.007663_35_plen_208_part_00